MWCPCRSRRPSRVPRRASGGEEIWFVPSFVSGTRWGGKLVVLRYRYYVILLKYMHFKIILRELYKTVRGFNCIAVTWSNNVLYWEQNSWLTQVIITQYDFVLLETCSKHKRHEKLATTCCLQHKTCHSIMLCNLCSQHSMFINRIIFSKSYIIVNINFPNLHQIINLL